MLNIIKKGMVNSFIINTRLQFDTGLDTFLIDYPLNCSINYLKMFVYNIHLTNDLYHSKVTEQLQNFYITGQLASVDTHLFTSSKSMGTLMLDITNMRSFMHRNGIEWIRSINSNLSVDFSDQNQIRDNLNQTFWLFLSNRLSKSSNFSLNSEYQYPDEDFCLFCKFPHEKLIVPVIEIASLRNCSCTILWLLQYVPLYFANSIEYFETSVRIECFSSETEFNSSIEACNFAQKILNCQLNQPKFVKNYDYKTNLDVHYDFFLYQYIFSVLLAPVFCLLGLFTNTLTILTVFKNRHEQLKDHLYIFMLINAIFNSLYSLIYMFNLMSECILMNSLFCSAVFNAPSTQYFKMLIVVYLGNVVKACSNLTYILMIVNRYMLVGRDHLKLLEQVSKIRISHSICLVVLIASALNIVKYFQYEVNPDFEAFEYPIIKHGQASQFANVMFLGANFLNDVLNYWIYSVLTTILDVITMLKFRQFMRQRRDLVPSSVTKLKKLQKKQLLGVLMIITNSTCNFLLRLPELSSLVYYTLFYFASQSWVYSYFCVELLACHLMIDVSSLFYLLSLSVNFLVYYLFNKKFRTCFRELRRRKRPNKV
jgi:hypothetical protein